MKGYSFNIIFSKKCNQNCYYCDVWSQDILKYNTEVDIDLLMYYLNYFPKHSVARINGGEPGLLTNLYDAVVTMLNHPNIEKVAIYSNGLVRYLQKAPLDHPNVVYQEHLIQDIIGKNIHTFYNMAFDNKYKYVVILTENTTNSLIDDFDYFLNYGLMTNNFYFKILVSKVISCDSYIAKIDKLFTLLQEKTNRNISFQRQVIERIKDKKEDLTLKKICASFPYNVYLDFETMQLGHCTMITSKTKTYPLNKYNIEKNLKGQLFGLDDACKVCKLYETSRDVFHSSFINKIPINYSFENTDTLLW